MSFVCDSHMYKDQPKYNLTPIEIFFKISVRTITYPFAPLPKSYGHHYPKTLLSLMPPRVLESKMNDILVGLLAQRIQLALYQNKTIFGPFKLC